ncbi:MAG: sensor histidine kinase, partial [Candidatus Binatia bacterium]
HTDLLLEEAAKQSMRDGEHEDSLLWIKRSAFTVLSLVEDYSHLSRLEGGQLPLAKAPLQLNTLLKRVEQQYKAQAQHGGLTLALDLQKELPWIEGDSSALERVFTNLVSNALKFTPAGGRITISSAHRRKEVVVAVVDNGPGIAPEDLPFIFEKYRRAAAARPHKGTGLGLFIVKALVEAHDGRITAESTPGSGTRFQVALPATSG